MQDEPTDQTSRRTTGPLRMWTSRSSVDTFAPDERDLEVEAALAGIGARPLGIARVHAIDEDDDEPWEPPDEVRYRPLQLLTLPTDPGLPVYVWALPDHQTFGIIERDEEGTWFSLLTVAEDGSVARTARRPPGIPAGPRPQEDEPRWRLPFMPPLLRWANGDDFDAVVTDHPIAGKHSQNLPTGSTLDDMVLAHQDLVRQRLSGPLAPADDVDLCAAATRWSLHVTDDFHRRLHVWLVLTHAGVVLASYAVVMLWLYRWEVPWITAVFLAILLGQSARRFGAFLRRESIGPLTTLTWAVTLLLASRQPMPLFHTSLALLALCSRDLIDALIERLLLRGRATAWLARRSPGPPRVPAARLLWAYRE